MAGQFSEVKLTLVCQVSKAKANHKVDTSNKLLRGINFPGDGKSGLFRQYSRSNYFTTRESRNSKIYQNAKL